MYAQIFTCIHLHTFFYAPVNTHTHNYFHSPFTIHQLFMRIFPLSTYPCSLPLNQCSCARVKEKGGYPLCPCPNHHLPITSYPLYPLPVAHRPLPLAHHPFNSIAPCPSSIQFKCPLPIAHRMIATAQLSLPNCPYSFVICRLSIAHCQFAITHLPFANC